VRITVEAVVRGEHMKLEPSEADFCPECCGTLEISGGGERAYLKCASCYAAYRPRKAEAAADGGST
jgi:hypothetical protein